MEPVVHGRGNSRRVRPAVHLYAAPSNVHPAQTSTRRHDSMNAATLRQFDAFPPSRGLHLLTPSQQSHSGKCTGNIPVELKLSELQRVNSYRSQLPPDLGW
jgi:hypothetical protein